MLTVLGVTEIEDAVYSELVATASATVTELSGTLRLQQVVVQSALSGLLARGLVTRTPTQPPRFVAAPPDIVVESMLLRRQAELSDARAELEHLVKAYRSGRRTRNPDELVEIVTGADQARERHRHHTHSAKREFVMFIKPPFRTVDLDHCEFLDDPGVSYRTIYDKAMLDIPNFGELMRARTSVSSVRRLHPSLPMTLSIADRQTAMLPLGRDTADTAPANIIVHSSGLVDALAALFEHYWEASTPLLIDADTSDICGLDHGDRRVLSLLVAGATDETIAHQLDVSLRTVRRRIQEMMRAASARNRAQLGWHAAQHNWLTPSDPRPKAPWPNR